MVGGWVGGWVGGMDGVGGWVGGWHGWGGWGSGWVGGVGEAAVAIKLVSPSRNCHVASPPPKRLSPPERLFPRICTN